MRRLFGWIRSAWLMLGITLFLLAVVEVASYLYLRKVSAANPRSEHSWVEADGYEGSDWIGPYLEEFLALRLQWEPYLYWRLRPFEGKYIHVGEDGVRRTPLPPAAEAPGVPSVMIFGGSTAWGEGVRDEHTVPAEVARLLAERGLPARVINAAEGGYVSTQEMLRLIRFLQAGNVPDLAVFYHGLNDVYSAAQSGEAGIPQNEWNRREEFNLTSRRIQVYQLALLGSRTGLSTPAAIRHLLDGPATDRIPEWPANLDHQVVATYKANVQAIHALGEQFGFIARFIWQPVIYQKPHRTPFETRMFDGQPEPFQDLFRRVESLIKEEQSDMAALGFTNLSDLFVEETGPLYIDYAHLTEEGNRRVAERVADVVEQALRSRR